MNERASPQELAGMSQAVIGPYEIIKVVSRTEDASIYLGIAAGSDREVQIKVVPYLDKHSRNDAADADAEPKPRLVHRHILRTLDVGEDSGLSYIVTEALRGRTLAEALPEAPAWDLATRVDIVAQLCLGLHHGHQLGVVHGDVKPANVFLTNDNVVKLLNVGDALPMDLTMVSDQALSGSFEYMSPERLLGRGQIDGRSDQFSAAVILYELITGQRPFQGASMAVTLARIVSDAPAPLGKTLELDAVVRRALEKDADQRYPSAQALAYALWQAPLKSAAQSDDEVAPAPGETVYAERLSEAEAQALEENAQPQEPGVMQRALLKFRALLNLER